MSSRLSKIALEINSRFEQIERVEKIRDHLELMETVAESHQMKFTLERVIKTINDFIDSMNKMEHLHPDFSPHRIYCFGNILEQTLIAVLVECRQMDYEAKQLFSKRSLKYLDQSERNRLLKVWYKQNDAKNRIREVLGNWDENTIRRILK